MENAELARPLLDAAAELIENHGGGPAAARVLLPHWRAFVVFLLQSGVTPTSIAQVPPETLRAFSVHCDLGGGTSFHDAPLVLGAVRLILLWSGVSAQALTNLSAPRVRRRVADDGKVNRQERFRAPAERTPEHSDQVGKEHVSITGPKAAPAKKRRPSGEKKSSTCT
jgi:hypothetical protein